MKKYIYILSFCMSFSLMAQEELLSEKISILKEYDQDHLHRVALPIGGIGTGTVSLGGSGELRDWEVMNVPAKGYSTVTTGNDAPFFAIYTRKKNARPNTKALLGPINPADYQHYEGRSVDHHGFPRFRNASFEATYPFGIVSLSDKTMPVKVKIVGYNPFIPADADASGIPMAILKYEVENTTSEDLEVAISGNIRNFIGKDGSKHTSDWKGDFIPIGAKDNKNEYRKTEKFQGIYMFSNGVDKNDAAWGTFAISTPNNKQAQITYRTSSTKNDWYNSTLNFWDDFGADGLLTEKDKQYDIDPLASLAVKKSLKAGETKTFTFYLTWNFPNRYAWSSDKLKNYYSTQYDNAWDVVEKEIDRLPALTEKTLQFTNSLIASTYPEEIKESALFNLSTLRSQTVFRTEDGKMFGWEGVMDREGSCFGSCTHVWNYEQATPFLFNKLALTMREVEFEYASGEDGHMGFRTKLPLQKEASGIDLAAADGQMGTIMKFYRDWQLSGDSEFLKKHWPKIKTVLAYAWIENGWDGDVDGVMEGVQHNTMDVEYYGPNPQMQIWYLGALRAAEEMAKFMDDKPFAKKCKSLFEYGSEWTDANLFNGEYYVHKTQVPESKEAIAKGLVGEHRLKGLDLNDPYYQLKTGCLVDQLVGQYMAHVLGLGYLVKEENVKTALQSIQKYNKRDGMYEHFNNMRSYAMGDEKALLMASWPNGGRPTIPFPYWSEVMTGFEYTAAIGMLYEGMEEEGLDNIKNIRDRYDGLKRNPFDEAECGHHYARAMASWAGVIAESGFQFSAIDKSIKFTDKPGKYFWSTGTAWGMCDIVKNGNDYEISLEVLHGKLELETIQLGNHKLHKFKGTRSINEGQKTALNY
ncbi:GH116 family glycosyl-hydrolase [Urechidicola vernalis]|uniref:GH116 family glycosyl-hydrolase n=1 Tax=Urechidicola vernalis TaxID=3075600 RepID=A0ABU2Y216_9FLAO|nr:GH116 family glycosyl-hydrolase [Urechidicola sp. P050]MDT0551846.1 GH116 family glycosyl-hydrolase [Urechidicola sp. P050]